MVWNVRTDAHTRKHRIKFPDRFHWCFTALEKWIEGAGAHSLYRSVHAGIQGVLQDLQQWLRECYTIHLYLTSNRVESSSSSFSSFKGAISTRSAGVVMMSYFLVFLIFLADLHIFMTRHVISKVVSTQMKIEMFLMVGRSLNIVERRDPTAASVVFCAEPSSWGGNVAFSGVAEDGRVCGSPFISCAMTISATAKVYSHMLFPDLNLFLLNVSCIWIESVQRRSERYNSKREEQLSDEWCV